MLTEKNGQAPHPTKDRARPDKTLNSPASLQVNSNSPYGVLTLPSCPYLNRVISYCCLNHIACMGRHRVVNGLDLCQLAIDRFYGTLPELKPWDRPRRCRA